MATYDSFDPWIDFLVTDPFCENPGTRQAAETAATSAALFRGDAPEARPQLELVHVRVARREPLLALQLPLPERPEIEGLRRDRRRRRTHPGWLDGERDDGTRH